MLSNKRILTAVIELSLLDHLEKLNGPDLVGFNFFKVISDSPVNYVKHGKVVSRSKLLDLKPFLDKNNVLRVVGGRPSMWERSVPLAHFITGRAGVILIAKEEDARKQNENT